MSKIKLSDMVTAISGSSKGITYALTRFGSVRKARGYKLQPTMVASSDQQIIFGSTAQQWRRLSLSDRALWNTLPPFFHPVNRWGEPFKHSSFSLFMMFNGDVNAAYVAAGLQRPVFNPTLLSGCVLWLDPAYGITLNGANVSNWLDRSGQGNHASESNPAFQPKYSTNAFNGKPCLNKLTSGGSAASSGLRITPLNLNAFTVFTVRQKGGAGNQANYLSNDAGTYWLGVDQDNNGCDNGAFPSYKYIGTGAAGNCFPAGAYELTKAIACHRHLGTAWSQRINAENFKSATYPTVSGINFSQISRYGTASVNSFNFIGLYAETVIYNRALSDSECEEVIAWLNTKYSVY